MSSTPIQEIKEAIEYIEHVWANIHIVEDRYLLLHRISQYLQSKYGLSAADIQPLISHIYIHPFSIYPSK